MDNKIVFKWWKCRLIFGRYLNGRIAIRLYNDDPIRERGYITDPGTELIATATVNVVDLERLADDEVLIKSYSENEGMLESLISAGIISEPLGEVKTGFVTVARCKLLVKPKFE
jgi:hypothetical protein